MLYNLVLIDSQHFPTNHSVALVRLSTNQNCSTFVTAQSLCTSPPTHVGATKGLSCYKCGAIVIGGQTDQGYTVIGWNVLAIRHGQVVKQDL